MPEASIVIKAEDRYSATLRSLSSVTKSFDKDVDRLEDTLYSLSKQKGTLNAALKEAGKQLSEAQKQFNATKDEAAGLQLELAQANYDGIKRNLEAVTRTARDTERQLNKVTTGSQQSGKSMQNKVNEVVGAIAVSGIGDMAKELASSLSTTFVSSAFGSDVGSIFSSGLSGAASGAAIGTMLLGPGLGTAAGAALGGGLGAANGWLQTETARDDAFKSYYQDQYNTVTQEQAASLSTGSALAAQREKDMVSFSTLFGSREAAKDYLSGLVDMANNTPFLYGDLTAMSKTLATYGYSKDGILPVLQTVGDAGAALDMDTGDMNAVATALGRMRSSDKTTLEYLNILNDRGIGAVGMLADSYGVDQGRMYEMISKGEVSGREAAQIILEAMADSFSGSMAEQSKTFSGITSTVEGLTQELDNAMGEGYNEGRMAGLNAQKDWLSGESGEAVMEANKAIGAWKAELENSKEQYIRDAVDAMMSSYEYQTAQAEGDAAEMGRLIMTAKVQGMNDYNASEGAQLALESELALAGAIRDDTASDSAYWDAGYRKGQEFSKGLAAGMTIEGSVASAASAGAYLGPGASSYRSPGYATGLERVPYNNFPALLHEGERVLTAREARNYGQNAGTGGVTITGNTFYVRQEQDIQSIAQELLTQLQLARMAGAN